MPLRTKVIHNLVQLVCSCVQNIHGVSFFLHTLTTVIWRSTSQLELHGCVLLCTSTYRSTSSHDVQRSTAFISRTPINGCVLCIYWWPIIYAALRLSVIRWYWTCLITARCYASAVGLLAMALCLPVCLSVRPSQVGVLLKGLNAGSHKQHHTIAQGL